MNLRRTTMVITQRCTLKCKLCLAFMPYYENPVDMTLSDVEKTLKSYFDIVDYVGIFSVTGGEPLMHKDIAKIMEMVFSYRNQIEDTIDMVTNGTIPIGEDLLQVLQDNKDKARIIVSNYGKDLSKNIDKVIKALEEWGINYRVQNYAGDDNWLFDGWVDFSDHSLKHDTPEKLRQQALRCIFRRGHYYVINDGELHPCSRSYWRMRTGVIPKNKEQYIDLLHANEEETEELKERLKSIENLEALNSCAYCNGVYNGIKRYKPAEQL